MTLFGREFIRCKSSVASASVGTTSRLRLALPREKARNDALVGPHSRSPLPLEEERRYKARREFQVLAAACKRLDGILNGSRLCRLCFRAAVAALLTV